MCTFFTIDKYYYVFLKCVNKDIILLITIEYYTCYHHILYMLPSYIVHVTSVYYTCYYRILYMFYHLLYMLPIQICTCVSSKHVSRGMWPYQNGVCVLSRLLQITWSVISITSKIATNSCPFQ